MKISKQIPVPRCFRFSSVPAILLATSLALGPAAAAKSKKETPPAPQKAAEEEEIPPSLDYDRRKAVSHRIELSPYGGDMLADQLNHSFIVGSNVQFNITERLALAADFGWSQAAADGGTPLGAAIANDNLYYVDGSFVTTMPAVLASKKRLIEADFFTTIGGGVLFVNGDAHGSGFVGGGIKIRPNIKWLAFRAEVRNYFTSVSNPAGSDFEYQIHFRLGPTFLIPPEF